MNPSKSALARAASTSRTQVHRDIARGAPTDTVEAYVQWRRYNVTPVVRVKPLHREQLARTAPPGWVEETERQARMFMLALNYVADEVHRDDVAFWNLVEAQMRDLGASPALAHEWAHELRGDDDEE